MKGRIMEETTETEVIDTTTTTTEDMIPASRLRGILNEKTKAEKETATLRARLEALEAEKLTDVEKLKRDTENAQKERDEERARNATLSASLATAAVASYFKDAHNASDAAALVPSDLVAVENGRLTDESRKALDAWKKSRGYLFDTGSRPGTIPGPGTTTPKDAAKRYAECVNKGDMAGAEAAFAQMHKTS